MPKEDKVRKIFVTGGSSRGGWFEFFESSLDAGDTYVVIEMTEFQHNLYSNVRQIQDILQEFFRCGFEGGKFQLEIIDYQSLKFIMSSRELEDLPEIFMSAGKELAGKV